MTAMHICNVCQGPDAFWGFGPPLTNVEIWACEMHLSQTESLLTKAPMTRQAIKPAQQGRLI